MPIRDRDSAEKWLQTQSREMQVAFATRAALRATPFLARSGGISFYRLDIPTARALLTAKVATYESIPAVRHNVKYTAMPANAVAVAVAAAAYARTATFAATFTAASAFAARTAFWNATDADAQRLERFKTPVEIFQIPLWHGEPPPEEITHALKHLRLRWRDGGHSGKFWLRWYEGMLNGAPMDSDLQTAVALINDDLWWQTLRDNDDTALANEIARIEFDFKTRIERRVVYDSQTGLLDLEQDPPADSDILRFVCEDVEMTLKTALDANKGNGLRDDSPETKALRYVIDTHPENANHLAIVFYRTCLTLEQNMKDGVYPPNDTYLTNLKNSLWANTEEIAEAHPEAKKRLQRYQQLGRIRPLSQGEIEEIPKVIDIAKQVTTDPFDDALDKTGEELQRPDPPKPVVVRFVNWITTIVSLAHRVDKIVDDWERVVKFANKLRNRFSGEENTPED